jgi:hypothetical protein
VSIASRFACFSAAACLAASTMGCAFGIAHEPPPPVPARVEPKVPDLPSDPPVTGHARVVLDAEGESARVSRVVAIKVPGGTTKPRMNGVPPEGPARAEEPLCITPCTVDLRTGMHTFVFASKQDPMRSSTSDIVLPGNGVTTFVRHAIGRERRMAPEYGIGAFLLVAGATVTFVGAFMTALGVTGEPVERADGTRSDPEKLILPGSIVFGSGILLTVGGAVMMSSNRPVEQRGTTTTWTKE